MSNPNNIQGIFESLNDEQKAAVLHIEGPVLINAGAGSGKTRVLTSRIAYLLSRGVPSDRILSLTFTKKAAGEMKSRIRSMVGDSAQGLVMGTFHSVFIGFLRPYAGRLGYPSNFTVYDEEDSEGLLRKCIEEVLFGPDKPAKGDKEESEQRKKTLQHYRTSAVKSRISLAKNNLINAEAYLNDPEIQNVDARMQRPALGKIYELYQQRMLRSGVMDFDDILLNMDTLLKQHKDALWDFGGRFDYILVDEYQDTNTVQYSILRSLTVQNRNICVVGDDSQSIYAFRGAKIRNILSFKQDYPGCGIYKLETNYRSTRCIVGAANRLIAHNFERIPKECISAGYQGESVEAVKLSTDREESRFVVDRITEGIRSGLHWRDHAVLYRTNSQSRSLEDALLRARIPYVIYSGTSFFDRQEVRDALSWFKLIVNGRDDEAFLRAIQRPSRGIGESTLTLLRQIASKDGKSLLEVCGRTDLGYAGVKPKALQSLREIHALVNDLSGRYCAYDADVIARQAIEESGLRKFYAEDKTEEGERRRQNVEEVLNSVVSFVQDKRAEYLAEGITDEVPSLDKYLEDMALLSNADTGGDADDDKVSLMTVHCAKGLEFPTVFVTGLEEGLFPMIRDGESNPEDLEEERRLMYVAMTRAGKKLYLTNTDTRLRYGQYSDNKPSRFLGEIADKDNKEVLYRDLTEH